MKEFPDAANMKNQTPFTLSKYSKNGLKICKEIQVNYDDWIEESVDSLWTIRTLKLWYFL